MLSPERKKRVLSPETRAKIAASTAARYVADPLLRKRMGKALGEGTRKKWGRILDFKGAGLRLYRKDREAFDWLCRRFEGVETPRSLSRSFHVLYHLVPAKENREAVLCNPLPPLNS